MDTKKQYTLRKGVMSDWEDAMSLAWKTFLKFEATDYEAEGIENFKKFITDSTLLRMFLLGAYPMFVALDEEKIVGLITLRDKKHISLLFVDGDYHKKGIGSALICSMRDYVKDEYGEKEITVNAAPFAVEFYHKVGFEDTAKVQERDGIIYTPMKKII